jgi:hypothetical protein
MEAELETIVLGKPWGGREIGDDVEVDPERAAGLRAAGFEAQAPPAAVASPSAPASADRPKRKKGGARG